MKRIHGIKYGDAIVQALEHHGPLQLKKLRSVLIAKLGWDMPLDVVKGDAMQLVEEKRLTMVRLGNGYVFFCGKRSEAPRD